MRHGSLNVQPQTKQHLFFTRSKKHFVVCLELAANKIFQFDAKKYVTYILLWLNNGFQVKGKSDEISLNHGFYI